MTSEDRIIGRAYLPEEERLYVQRSYRNLFLLDEHEAKEDYFAVSLAASLIIQFAIKDLNISTLVYFAIRDKENELFSSKSVPGKNYFVIIIGGQPFYDLITFCNRLAALPPFCLTIGKKEVQTSFDYKNNDLLQIVKKLCKESEGISHILFPSEFDLTMINAALTYIIGHEIAHVTHGHLSFISSEKFEEIRKNDKDKDLTRRTLEMDADSSGTSLVVSMFEDPVRRKFLAGCEMDKNDENALKSNRYKYIAGIYAAHLYGDARLENLDTRLYPTPYARFLVSKKLLQLIYKKHFQNNGLDELPNTVRTVLAKTFITMSGQIQSLEHPFVYNMTLVNDDSSKNIYIYHPEGEDEAFLEIKSLNGRWAKIRPYLEKLQTGGKLAPAQADPN